MKPKGLLRLQLVPRGIQLTRRGRLCPRPPRAHLFRQATVQLQGQPRERPPAQQRQLATKPNLVGTQNDPQYARALTVLSSNRFAQPIQDESSQQSMNVRALSQEPDLNK